MPSPSAENRNDPARQVFLSHLARLAAGQEEDFEELCARNPELAERLRELRTRVSHGARDGAPRPSPSSARVRRLLRVLRKRSRGQRARYVREGEIDRGAMGVVHAVRDADLRRRIAMKVLRPRAPREGEEQEALLARFLDEAQVTAQLEHPGIVPVYDLGLDAEGRPFFTMQRVRGEDLRKVFARVREGRDGWTRTRALGVVQRICEAMAYAHAKGVVHRDLKPANVMVGRFGEVYVMDWGLAHVVGRPQPERPALRPDMEVQSFVRTERTDAHEVDPDSPLYTMDGDVVGTPAYMAPEQARGELARLGPWTDVYAVGAILYQLLAGRMPYLREDGRALPPHALWHAVLAGPPEPLEQLAPDAPPELLAICAKAMARETDARYPDMQAISDDLRAYLEDRVVQAHRTGALIEFRKWVRRNRPTAASLAALVCVLAASGFLFAFLQARRGAEAQQRLEELALESLVASVDQLWPVHPDSIPAMDAWLERARTMEGAVPAARAALSAFLLRHADQPREQLPPGHEVREVEFQVRALQTKLDTFARCLAFLRTGDPNGLSEDEQANELLHPIWNEEVLALELPDVQADLVRKRGQLAARMSWRFLDPDLNLEHLRLRRQVQRLEQLVSAGGLIRQIESRRARASGLAAETVERHAAAWAEARRSIGDPQECPLYNGMELSRQIGLVPLRRDASSGLWEFWHVLSGERPEPGPDGQWRIRPDTGVVLVLVPGGAIHLGAQDDDPDGPNYCAPEEGIGSDLLGAERWLEEVEVQPFFLSKYELTQGQYVRLGEANPSEYWSGYGANGQPRFSRSHPVENVSWGDGHRLLSRWSLQHPTEAQWERAARAGLQTKYSSGMSFETLLGHTNLRGTDRDRHPAHAPVDAYEPNGWGFHGMSGNVWEWCRDWFSDTCERGSFEGPDAEHVPQYAGRKSLRGGGFHSTPEQLRVSYRRGFVASAFQNDLGLRPARGVAP